MKSLRDALAWICLPILKDLVATTFRYSQPKFKGPPKALKTIQDKRDAGMKAQSQTIIAKLIFAIGTSTGLIAESSLI